MIKISNVPAVLAVLLACASGAASAAGSAPLQRPVKAAVCAGSGTAMAQLAAAAPGGPKALAALLASIPAPNSAPRGGLGAAGMIHGVSAADHFITGAADSARKAGRVAIARLLVRFLEEGTPEEKLEFMNGRRNPYKFPARFYEPSPVALGLCEWITETICSVSCRGTGVDRECREDCRNVLVRACGQP